jgi:dienelactone hydrolase
MRRGQFWTAVLSFGAIVASVGAIPSQGSANAPGVPKTACDVPAGEPASGSPEFIQRDQQNILCAGQKVYVDQMTPSFIVKNNMTIPANYFGVMNEQLGNLPRGPGAVWVPVWEYIPGANVSDPYRMPADWQTAGRGSTEVIHFNACSGARLNGRLWVPNPATSPKPTAGWPGIVISTGAVQAFQEIYFWAAQGLAEAGYMVLTYDVQGQGRSDTSANPTYASGATCGSAFVQGLRDGLAYLRSNSQNRYRTPEKTEPGASSFNPYGYDLDLSKIGIAGHSAGAAAVSSVGQEDPDVKAIVAWDCLSAQAVLPATAPDRFANFQRIHAPALGICSEYGFNQTAKTQAPSRDFKAAGFKNLSGADIGTDVGTVDAPLIVPTHPTVDTAIIIPRASTHLEYDYVPYVFPSTRYGERVAMYYTLAWFDRYVRGVTSATARLAATRFDGSADASAIGAGTYDATTNSNVPYEIEGDCTSNRLSFYYNSRYYLEGGTQTNDDMQHMEPNTDPSTYCGTVPTGLIPPL